MQYIWIYIHIYKCIYVSVDGVWTVRDDTIERYELDGDYALHDAFWACFKVFVVIVSYSLINSIKFEEWRTYMKYKWHRTPLASGCMFSLKKKSKRKNFESKSIYA